MRLNYLPDDQVHSQDYRSPFIKYTEKGEPVIDFSLKTKLPNNIENVNLYLKYNKENMNKYSTIIHILV